MDEEGYSGVVDQIQRFLGGRVRGHDDNWIGIERR